MSQAIDKEIEQETRQVSLDNFGVDRGEIGVRHKGVFDKNDYLRAYDNLVKNPSFDGFDTQFKLAVLFKAVQNEMGKNGQLQIERCDCRESLTKDNFAREFVDAYDKYMANTKTRLAKETTQILYEAVSRNWISLIEKIVGDIVPIIKRYLSTDARKLNCVDDFPYVIKDGVIYHDRCFED